MFCAVTMAAVNPLIVLSLRETKVFYNKWKNKNSGYDRGWKTKFVHVYCEIVQ